MSKIFDEMREIAKEENAKGVTNKTLLRFAITGLVDVNDRLELLLRKNEARDDEIEKINDGLEKLQETVNGDASEMEKIKDAIKDANTSITETKTSMAEIKTNLVWRIGNYLEGHPKFCWFIVVMIILLVLHVFGSLSGMITSIEDLMKLVGIVV